MTKKMRKRYSQALAKDRKRAERRARGIIPRVANITNTQPWEAFGISRKTWYRWGKPVSWEAVTQLRHHKFSNSKELLVSSTIGWGKQGYDLIPEAKPVDAPVPPSQMPALADHRPPPVHKLSRSQLEAMFARRRGAA